MQNPKEFIMEDFTVLQLEGKSIFDLHQEGNLLLHVLNQQSWQWVPPHAEDQYQRNQTPLLSISFGFSMHEVEVKGVSGQEKLKSKLLSFPKTLHLLGEQNI